MKRFIPFFLVILVSLLIHVFFLLRLPSFQLVKYSHAAELALQGKLQGERILDFSPLYLYLNMLLKKTDTPSSVLLWIHLFCAALSAALLFQILRRYFRVSVAIVGTAAFILDRSLMVYTHTFEPEPIVLLLILAATSFLSLQTSPAAFIGGLCFGLGILTRPNFVPVLLAVPVFYRVNSKDSTWLKKAALFVIPALLCLAGLWVRNANIVGYFSPFVMNPGTALYEGNNSNSWGMSSVYPPVLNQVSQQHARQPDYHHQLYRDFARKITGKNLTLAQVNSYWTVKATNYLLDHPRRTLRLLTTKSLHFFHDFQWHDLAVAHSTEKILKRSWRFHIPFAILSAFALVGLCVLSLQWRRYLIFYAVFFTQFLFMLSIYVSARQRMSILFLFVFFACGALEHILVKKRWWLLIGAGLLSIPLYIRTDLMREEEHLWISMQNANQELAHSYRLRNQTNLKEAAVQSAQALASAPWLWDSLRPANLPFEDGFTQTALTFSHANNHAEWMDQAVLLLESGRTHEAEKIFLKLHESGYSLKRDDYQSSELQFYMARCAIKNRQRPKAIELLERAIRSSPGDPSTLAYFKALTGDAKYEQQLLRYFDDIDAAFFLGKAYLETGNPESAVKHFQYVTGLLPEFRKGFIYLSAAMSAAGRYKEASIQYRIAISMNPDPVFHDHEILKAFQQLALAEQTALNHYAYGVVLRQFGHFTSALAEQRKAVALDPSNKDIEKEIHGLMRVIQALQ